MRPTRITAPLTLTFALSLAAFACADGSSDADRSPAAPTSTSPASSSEPAAEPRTLRQKDLRDVRYCELLVVGDETDADGLTEASVWGTQGLNDCPQDKLEAIDTGEAAQDLGALITVKNGPRHWVLDQIERPASMADRERREFSGLEMGLLATVKVNISERAPYVDTEVARDTVFRFLAGRTVPVLTSPTGATYVMQSYSLEVDPTLTLQSVNGLGDRLELPDGWTFDARNLAEDLDVLSENNVATVIQDELHNTYQRFR